MSGKKVGELAAGGFHPAFLLEGLGEVLFGGLVVRFKADGFLEGVDGFVDAVHGDQGIGHVVVGFGVVGPEGDGLLGLGQAVFVFAGLA